MLYNNHEIKMDLTIKFMNQTKLILNNIDETFTVSEIKLKIQEKFPDDLDKYEISKLKLVHDGKVLINEKTLDFYKVLEKPIIYCIISKEKSKVHPKDDEISKNIPENKEIINEPKIEENIPERPETPQPINNGNPLLSNLLNSQGGIPNNMSNLHANMMNNPAAINLSMRMMSDPQIMPLMTQMMSNPSLMSDPNFIMTLMSNPHYMEFMNEYMQLLNQNQGGQEDLSEMYENPPLSSEETPTEQINYEEKYKTQLEELSSMGFYDKVLNVQCLRRSKGDVNTALNFLLDIYK